LLHSIAALVTRQAARYGIELRHPLLDHRLFDFAAALPTAQTFAAGQRKVVLRNAMHGRLPEAVLDGWDKTYPAAIAHRGLREREQAKVWALMTDMRAAEMGFVDEHRLRSAYTHYLEGRSENTRFWHTLTLEAWLRRYFS
jgi:asparagine synthase (glutamine-hydrolysing)